MNKKFIKLIKDPNRFFFDYFSKKLGGATKSTSGEKFIPKKTTLLLPPAGFTFDDRTHPIIQIAEKFNLRSGALTGHVDQSLLVDSTDLLKTIEYTFWLASGLDSQVRIYTLGGGVFRTFSDRDLLDINKIEKLYSSLATKPDFVVEFLSDLPNNFATHFFVFDVSKDGLIQIRSNLAYLKKCTIKAFENTFPRPINKFGDYEFGTPWPVDVVYTWVNKDDSNWQSLWKRTFPNDDFNPDRFSSRDELRFSLRSISKFLPWHHKVYIVSNCKQPSWLKNNGNLIWLTHEEIFPSIMDLPTFNSHAIECCLHKIPNLSEKFIYFNDDVFVNRPAYFSDFFDETGRSISNLEPYGMAGTDNIFDDEKDYLFAAKNSHDLISENFPNYKARQLHRHVPHALIKSTLEEIEKTYEKEIRQTRSARIRSKSDLNLTSFLYHHFALASGRCIPGNAASVIIRPKNIAHLESPERVTYKFFCVNDGEGSADNEEFTHNFHKVINKIFPNKSKFELDEPTFPRVKVSTSIMAYTTRKHRIPYLRKMIGNASISIDDGSLGIVENSFKSWALHDENAEYHLMIQDDSVICTDFYKRLENLIIQTNGKSVDAAYALYFRLKNENKSLLADFNQKARDGLRNGYFYDKYLRFGIATMIPTRHVKPMIAHAENLESYGKHDDSRYSHYLAKTGIPVIYPLPSLVNQSEDLKSTHEDRTNAALGATWFADGVNKFNKNPGEANHY